MRKLSTRNSYNSYKDAFNFTLTCHHTLIKCSKLINTVIKCSKATTCPHWSWT